MDYYFINEKQATKLINTMEKYRKSKNITEYTGNDLNEKRKSINYIFSNSQYGTPIHFYLMVVGNSFSLNIMYHKYRVSYTMQAPDNWKDISVEAFGDGFYGDLMTGEKISDSGIQFIIATIEDSFKKGGMYNTVLAKSTNYLQNAVTQYAE